MGINCLEKKSARREVLCGQGENSDGVGGVQNEGEECLV